MSADKYIPGLGKQFFVQPEHIKSKDGKTFDELVPKDIDSKLASTESLVKEANRNNMKPRFVEYFASFNKFGAGTPTGVTNYTGGNYVLTVNGTAGDSFVTVTAGDISHAGASTKWPCVIRNNDGIFSLNQVTGTDGVSKVNLLRPLSKNITATQLGNLHDMALGQHYTELGYFAFAQHLYFSTPKYTERDAVLSQFLPTDTTGDWVLNGVSNYNLALNMKATDGTYTHIGAKRLSLYCVDDTKNGEYTATLDGRKGYVETFVGVSTDTSVGDAVKVEFYLDDILVDTKISRKQVERVIFPYENAKKGKIKISGLGVFPLTLAIGMTTWFASEKYSKDRLISPSDKVVYMGDSWGEYHNKAVTRELERLMRADGGEPTILNYSKGGHSSDYARAWFQKYVIDNKPDKVIIEYFTNDFNSINGTNLGNFTNPAGQPQEMNIATLAEYTQNMRWMIDEAIKNGIEPIVVMPASTNSDSQTQGFGDKAVQIWLGNKVTNESPSFKSIATDSTTTSKVTSKDSTGVGSGTLPLMSKEINSSARKGVMSDSDTGASLTGGDIHGFYNNNVRKAGVKHNGTLDTPFIQFQGQTTNTVANVGNRGTLYVKDDPGVLDDEVHIILQKGDGTYVRYNIPIEEMGTAAPTTGTYRVGNRVVNSAPTAGGYLGWVCITAGTPGVWKGYGAIQA